MGDMRMYSRRKGSRVGDTNDIEIVAWETVSREKLPFLVPKGRGQGKLYNSLFRVPSGKAAGPGALLVSMISPSGARAATSSSSP